MKKPLTNKAGEVRELTKRDFKAMKPIKEVLPELANIVPKRKRGERGAQKHPKKILITSRYSEEVVKYFKKTGEGWQTRMDIALKSFIKEHPKFPKNTGLRQKHSKSTKHTRHAA